MKHLKTYLAIVLVSLTFIGAPATTLGAEACETEIQALINASSAYLKFRNKQRTDAGDYYDYPLNRSDVMYFYEYATKDLNIQKKNRERHLGRIETGKRFRQTALQNGDQALVRRYEAAILDSRLAIAKADLVICKSK